MKAYYNEFDKNAAAWLRELIKEGLITDGEVDERSIEDVLPADLAGFDRCHFFAGIGVWDYALNLAGMDGQVWTGSCPCQPFSSAGKREGTADERHLWPAFFHLIQQCRPDTLFGEQVSSKDGRAWLDIVHADLEAAGYTVGALDLPACSVGAPHKRQRFFFVADTGCNEPSTRRRDDAEVRGLPKAEREPEHSASISRGSGESRIVADTSSGNARTERIQRSGEHGQRQEDGRAVEGRGLSSGVDDTSGDEHRADRGAQGEANGISQVGGSEGFGGRISRASGDDDMGDASSEGLQGRLSRREDSGRETEQGHAGCPGPTNGFWRHAEWIYCRDGKYRPTKPGIFPLVNGATGRVALLRGAGNAISPWVAKAFIEAWLEVKGEI